MSQVRRIYAEKRPGYDVSAQQLCRELCEVLGTQDIERVRIFQRYDVEGVSEAALESAKGIIFSEPNVDVLYDENLPEMDAHLLAIEYLPGQYDQRADSASQCLQLLSPNEARPKVVCAKVLIPNYSTIIHHSAYVEPIAYTILIFRKPMLHITIFFLILTYI